MAKRAVPIKWSVSFPPRILVILRKQSEKSGVPMSRLIERLILRAEKEGWA